MSPSRQTNEIRFCPPRGEMSKVGETGWGMMTKPSPSLIRVTSGAEGNVPHFPKGSDLTSLGCLKRVM